MDAIADPTARTVLSSAFHVHFVMTTPLGHADSANLAQTGIAPLFHLPDLGSPVQNVTPLSCSPAPSPTSQASTPIRLFGPDRSSIWTSPASDRAWDDKPGAELAIVGPNDRLLPSDFCSEGGLGSLGSLGSPGDARPVANGLTSDQIRHLWQRARPALRGRFRGAVESAAFDVLPDRMRQDRKTPSAAGGPPLPDIWSGAAALWKRHEDQFVRDLQLPVARPAGTPLAATEPSVPGGLSSGASSCYYAAGDDKCAFAAQFEVIEQAQSAFRARQVRQSRAS